MKTDMKLFIKVIKKLVDDGTIIMGSMSDNGEILYVYKERATKDQLAHHEKLTAHMARQKQPTISNRWEKFKQFLLT